MIDWVAMGWRNRQRLWLGVAAIPVGSCAAPPSNAVSPPFTTVCHSAAGPDAPVCLLPGGYGQIILKDNERGLRVYEHCVQGKVSPNRVVFEVPGANYEFQILMSLLEPLRERLPRSVEQLLAVNLEPCSWDRASVSCIRVETKDATREGQLADARPVFDAIRAERDQAGRASTCVPVVLAPSSGPVLAIRAGAPAAP